MDDPSNETRAIPQPIGPMGTTLSPASPPPGGPAGTPKTGKSAFSVAGVVIGGIAVVAALVVGASLVLDDDGGGDVTTTIDETAVDPLDDGSDAPNTEPTTPSSIDPTPAPSANELAASVVQILAIRDGQPVCTGSGTVIDADGTILTNFHVIEQIPACAHDTLGVAVTQDPSAPPVLLYSADVLAVDAALDLAVIRIARSIDGSAIPVFTPISVGDSDVIDLGDRLRVIGYPGIGGDTVTITEGLVSGFVTTPEGGNRSWIKTDATIAGGNSGGLATNEAGEIVGVPTIVGTGDGPVVDCRMLADSNGDGQLDQDDACVPTGGFINGVRPIGLAAPLIEQARTATPQLVAPPVAQPASPSAQPSDLPGAFAPVWTLGVDDTGNPTDPILAAVSGTTNICLTWQYERVPVGSSFDLVWSVDGVTGEGDISSGTTGPPENGSFFGCYGNPNGLPDGLYQAEWRINGTPVFIEAILVGGNRQRIDVVVTNASIEPICVVSIAPNAAVSWGLNELSAAVQPGESVVLSSVTGLHDIRGIDCLGNTIFDERGVDFTTAGISVVFS